MASLSTDRLRAVHAPDAKTPTEHPAPRVAVLIPCFNEEVAIGTVVRDFRAALPEATIYVYDNNSSDGTAGAARRAGAVVRHEARQGKGNVVRRMFADIDADVYVLVDGDGTYDAASARSLVDRLLAGSFDMVNASRVPDSSDAYRPGHRFGNRLLTAIVAAMFGRQCQDMLSGYRALSRRFVKTFPVHSNGFEIETELTVHALGLQMPTAEIATPYRARAEGSTSKLSTWRDGLRILRLILVLVKAERPLLFFLAFAALFACLSLGLAWPLFVTYAQTGLVPRLPTAVLATGLMILASLSLACGLILETVTRGRQEVKRLHYLEIAGPAIMSLPPDL